MTRIVSAAFAAVVSNGAPSVTAAEKARSCQAKVVSSSSSSSGPRRSAAGSADATVPFCVITSRPSCASTKLRSQSWPASPMTCTSALKSPSRVKADSNQPVRPVAKPSRAARARSAGVPATGSASAPVTDGSPAPAAAPISRRQSIA